MRVAQTLVYETLDELEAALGAKQVEKAFRDAWSSDDVDFRMDSSMRIKGGAPLGPRESARLSGIALDAYAQAASGGRSRDGSLAKAIEAEVARVAAAIYDGADPDGFLAGVEAQVSDAALGILEGELDELAQEEGYVGAVVDDALAYSPEVESAVRRSMGQLGVSVDRGAHAVVASTPVRIPLVVATPGERGDASLSMSALRSLRPTGSGAEVLLASQGYDVADVSISSSSPFLASLAYEALMCPSDRALPVALLEGDVGAAARALDKVQRGADLPIGGKGSGLRLVSVGLWDPQTGVGGPFRVRLERPAAIPASCVVGLEPLGMGVGPLREADPPESEWDDALEHQRWNPRDRSPVAETR